jgi:two-component system cell cycle sensor histidine kinase/response regulator CckA
MVDLSSLLPLLYNGALLLALAFIYDVLAFPMLSHLNWRQQVLLGFTVGAIGVIVMLTPWLYVPGIVFDTRSVLLSISGLFFGVIPTLVAVVMTAALRLYQGGAGAYTGVAVIVATSLVGLGWRYWRKPRLAQLAWGELYLFGVVVHIVMLLLLLTLPWPTPLVVLPMLVLPVMLIYPMITALLGRLLVNRLRRDLAVAALSASEERHRSYVDNSPYGVFVVDDAGRYVEVNPAACAISGYSAAELLTMRIADSLSPESQTAGAQHFQQVVAVGRSYDEIAFRRKDGSTGWWSVAAVRLSPNRFLGFVIDITERKHAEALALAAQTALRQSEERFRHVASSISDVAYSCVEAGDGYALEWMTGAVERITGYTVAEVVAMRCWGLLVQEEDRPSFDREILALAPGGGATCELRLRRRDGAVIWVEATAECVADAPGRRLYGALVDITARKQAEVALRQSEEKALALLNAIGDAAFLIEPAGRVLALNMETARRLGRDGGEILGRSIYDLLPPDVARRQQEKVQTVLTTRLPLRFEDIHAEAVIDNSIYPIFDANGAVVQVAIFGRDVTSQRKAEERYQTLFREMLDGFALHEIICDAQGAPVDYRFLDVNPAFERLTGLAAANVLGKTVLEVLPATEAYWIETYGRVALTGAPASMQNYSRAINRYFEVTVFAPAPGQFATIFADVTERKRAELALVRRDALLEALSYAADRFLQAANWEQEMPGVLAHLGEAAQVSRVYLFQNTFDAHGGVRTSQRFEWCAPGVAPQIDELALQNAAYEAMGFARWPELLSRGELIRGHVRDLPESERALLGAQNVLSLVEVPIHVDGSWWGFAGFEHCDQEYEWSDAEIESLRAAGNVFSAAVKSQDSRQQLRAQAGQVAQIMRGVAEGLLLVDDDGAVRHANPRAAAYLELLTGQPHCRQLTHLAGVPWTVLRSSPPAGQGHAVQQGGRTFDVLAHPVESEQRAIGWVLVIRDVTDELATQQQLQRQERLAAIGQLAAGIAHDFNNLMSVIILYAQLLAQSPNIGERERDRLNLIEQQGQRGAKMIRQILDFSRRTVLERQPLNLTPLLQEQVKLLERTLPEHITVQLQVAPGDYVVRADPTRIEQIIVNLAVNARDAMPEGGDLILALDRLQVGSSRTAPVAGMRPGAWVQLAVKDTGTGIAAEALDHLFEPFFTTKAPGLGTGLGLAQVHGIVAQHDGFITVASAAGQGATFTIYLPALTMVTPDMAPTAPPSALASGAGQRILVVEDDPALQRTLAELLELWNYRVATVANGKAALALLEQTSEPFDLILSDVVMPEMSGLALFRTLRQRQVPTPVVLMTGHPMVDELEGLRAMGLQAWLPKPPVAEQLAETIARVLKQE